MVCEDSERKIALKLSQSFGLRKLEKLYSSFGENVWGRMIKKAARKFIFIKLIFVFAFV